MKTLYIYFHNIADVKEFISTVNTIKGNLTLSEGWDTINAKDIMEILKLNLANQLRLDVEIWKEEYTPLFVKYLVEN